ncbi:MAG: RNA 2',3'-cyclic phosphodiesterase [Rhodospirillales bacterium]|nr:MAG: RNA 2',3'-cyclic phosphodiesterase [Rhodospirillales bacterium]
MFRLFVALPLPDDVRAHLASLCSGLPGARWVAPEAMHVTLRFIGEVGGAEAEDVHEVLGRIQAPAFRLTLSGLGCFESGRKVHTLWVGVEREPHLLHLQEKIESAVVRTGLEPERRKFKAHVTLARFRNGDSPRIGSFIERNNRLALSPFVADRFTLYRSFLGRQGPHYEALADYPLETTPAAAEP